MFPIFICIFVTDHDPQQDHTIICPHLAECVSEFLIVDTSDPIMKRLEMQ